ncbi:hypothetical protein [Catellatospora sp. NPDC049133]|jgi:hypothetical protein|uniref:hypothetical protein n=1 Tax=Catellatospora sp. NPDC049133 TaxID=3155499 RepID=UPI0033F3A128
MTEFLTEFGGRLADRWATLIVLPGLLFVAAATAAYRLGHRSALDTAALFAWLTDVTTKPASRNTGAILLVVAAVLAAAIAAGLLAGAVGRLLETVWLTPGRRRPARLLLAWRRRRWAAADAAVTAAAVAAARATVRSGGPADTTGLGAALARREAICLVEPDRPTWVADRFRAADLRVLRTYELDLGSAWPRLWTLAPQQLRDDITAAQESYADAARLHGWGVLYLALAAWWWPAAVIAACVVCVGSFKLRAAAGVLAELVETTVDLYGRDLAQQLGIEHDGPFTAQVGQLITLRLRKDHPASPPATEP